MYIVQIFTLFLLYYSSLIFFQLGWNLRETPKSWEGLLVKAQFKCESNNFETHHCVVIKYAGTFKGIW